MSSGKQNGDVLPEYTVDNLGTSFKVVLVNSAQRTQGGHSSEIFIPNYQGLMKQIAVTRAAHPRKLQGADVKFLRKNLGLKAKDLAEKLDISPEHLSRCESGDKVLSANSEKVLRTLVLMEAIYVLQKAIENAGDEARHLLDRVTAILKSAREVVSEIKISPVHIADEQLVLHFKLLIRPGSAANDHEGGEPEWLDEEAA